MTDTPDDEIGFLGDLPLPPLSEGMVVAGTYRLEEEIGRNKSGSRIIYRAIETRIGALVALKVITLSASSTSTDGWHPRREFEVASQLSHPNIVPLLRVFEEPPGKRLFLVMPFIQGRDLRRLLQEEGPRPPAAAAQIIFQMAEALAYCHDHDLFHRDLKPENIVLEDAGHAWLLDFGVSASGREMWDEAGKMRSTPSYAPPVVLTGDSQNVDWSAEVYSLGLILLELITGKGVIEGDTKEEIFVGAVLVYVVTLEFDDDMPLELREICLRCLKKDRRDRFLTARDLAESLRVFLMSVGEPVPPTTLPPRDELGKQLLLAWRLGRHLAKARYHAKMYAARLTAALTLLGTGTSPRVANTRLGEATLDGIGVVESLKDVPGLAAGIGLQWHNLPDDTLFHRIIRRPSCMSPDDRKVLGDFITGLDAAVDGAVAAVTTSLTSAGERNLATFDARFRAGWLAHSRSRPELVELDGLHSALHRAGIPETFYRDFLDALRGGSLPDEAARHLHIMDRYVDSWIQSYHAPTERPAGSQSPSQVRNKCRVIQSRR